MNPVDRDRLVNSVLFFASGVKDCRQKKLFALLYVADVRHFQATGRTITRLAYFAGDLAPYPHHLSHELQGHLREDLERLITLHPHVGDPPRNLIRAREGSKFSEEHFTRRQLGVMDAVLADLGHVPLEEIDFDKIDNGAWRRALTKGKHKQVQFEEAVAKRDANAAAVLEQAAEYRGRESSLARRAFAS